MKNQSKTNTAIRKIASYLINNFDSDDVFKSINNDDLQIITAEDWFTSEHKIENDIYELLYTHSSLKDDILKQIYNKDNNKIVCHTDIIDLIVRFLNHTTEDDIL